MRRKPHEEQLLIKINYRPHPGSINFHFVMEETKNLGALIGPSNSFSSEINLDQLFTSLQSVIDANLKLASLAFHSVIIN